jgi:glucosamine-6-phosphate deaminase
VEVVIVDAAEAAGSYVADRIESLVRRKENAVLGLATGSSPLPVYQELAGRVAGGLDMSKVRGFALDEYVGLDYTHPESYHSVIAREVIEPLALTPELVQVPPGSAPDLDTASVNFEQAIAAAGGVDLQILGIGTDGHLGFNEPTSSFASRTRIKTLTPRTRRDNARFFSSLDEVPTHCLTQGLGTILDARELILVALGEAKAAAVAAAVEGPVAAICPASALQLHRFATLVLDRDAASRLRFGEYYEYVFANKPD